MTEERNTAAPETEESRNFILNLIDQDIAEGGQFQGQTVHTRFPPEPNGYLHIGHCKALCIDFGTAEKFGGLCNLRMDDTNPAKEDTEYVDAIQQDIHWLGFDWGDRFFLRLRLLREGLRVCRGAHQEGAGLRLRADARGVQANRATSASPLPPPIGIGPSRKICGCSKR